MFEVTPNRAISVETFHVTRLSSSPKTYNFQVFTRPGSWAGSESSSTGWTKISEDGLSVTSSDPVIIPMSKMTPVTVYAGVTQSFYIQSTTEWFVCSQADMGTAATDSAISLYTGRGVSSRDLFSSGSTKKRFIGNMKYSYRSDKPSSSPSLSPTLIPSPNPSVTPTHNFFPSHSPSISVNPTSSHLTAGPTLRPTSVPTPRPTQANVPKLTFTIPSAISIRGFGVPQTDAEIATVVEITGPSIAALVKQNLNENQSVTVVILSINGIPVPSGSRTFTGRHLVFRILQDDALDIQYEIILEEICATVDCSDKQPQEIANLLYTSVTESMQDQIDSGAFVVALEQRATQIGKILEIAIDNSNFSEVVVAVLSLVSTWYPSFTTDEYCLNDGNSPWYMTSNAAGWLYNNRDGCCTRYYAYDYTACMGVNGAAAIGYYPAWDGTEKCRNDRDVPDYMRRNPSLWIYDDIESCCGRYYNWAKADCVSRSGGTTSEVAAFKWYVNHENEVCEQDCLKSNGHPCGGLVPTWKVLYETPVSCCKNTLSWITPSVCEAASSGTTYPGTDKWYAYYQHDKCVQDCAASTKATCGGILESAHVDLFDTAKSCCRETLGWVNSNSCQAESTYAVNNFAGSGGWYVNYKLSQCVQDCVGVAPCGKLAESWDNVFTSAGDCCSTKLWWLEASTCILA